MSSNVKNKHWNIFRTGTFPHACISKRGLITARFVALLILFTYHHIACHTNHSPCDKTTRRPSVPVGCLSVRIVPRGRTASRTCCHPPRKGIPSWDSPYSSGRSPWQEDCATGGRSWRCCKNPRCLHCNCSRRLFPGAKEKGFQLLDITATKHFWIQ